MMFLLCYFILSVSISHHQFTYTYISLYVYPVFSLNFSSAGKGSFMDGKAKNIYFSKTEGGSGVRDTDPPSLGNFLFPYFKTYFTQICCRYL